MAVNAHRFIVHYRSAKKSLPEKRYESIDEIKQEIFRVFDKENVSDRNAIIVYHDQYNREILLTNVPDSLPKKQTQILFIKCVRILFHYSSLSLTDDNL